MEKNELFICVCQSPEHQMIAVYDEDENEVMLTMHLQPLPLHKRLWSAIKYIFNYKSRYGAWDNFLVKPEDKERFINTLNKIKTNV